MLSKMTDEMILSRMKFVEDKIAKATHVDDLKNLNTTYQKLLDEQVRRDLEKEEV
jgi:hypothetical protein